MAFVAEKIVSEQDKNYVASIGFTYVTGKAMPNPRYWAIDREKEIVFVSTGGGGPELPEGYALYFHGMIIEMIGENTYKGNPLDNSLKIYWRFDNVNVPKAHLEKGGDIERLKEIIREACIAYASRGLKPSQIQDIVVEFKEEFTVK